MTFGEILEHLERDLLKRDTTPEMLRMAVREAHSGIQRLKDWPCMKGHIVTYISESISIPADVRRVSEVNIIHCGRKVALIQPSSMDLNREHEEGHQSEFGWWIEEGKLKITPRQFGQKFQSGSSDNGQPHQIRIDWYRKLPSYVNPTDQDWFSVWAEDALAYRAAEIATLSLPDDGRAQLFAQIATNKISDAWTAACDSDSGGTAGIYRPPMRIPHGAGGHTRGWGSRYA